MYEIMWEMKQMIDKKAYRDPDTQVAVEWCFISRITFVVRYIVCIYVLYILCYPVILENMLHTIFFVLFFGLLVGTYFLIYIVLYFIIDFCVVAKLKNDYNYLINLICVFNLMSLKDVTEIKRIGLMIQEIIINFTNYFCLVKFWNILLTQKFF